MYNKTIFDGMWDEAKMNNYQILFRKDSSNESEFTQAKNIFGDDLKTNRVFLSNNKIVIGRYSVLPFYKELCDDLEATNSRLINTYEQHRYTADMYTWYHDLIDYTPRTWFRMEDIPASFNGPFVLKGETNSKKFSWFTHMFAKNREDAIQVMLRLYNDSLISTQRICIREYVPLNRILDSVYNTPPISEEYRFFILNNKVIYSKFYWSNFANEIEMFGERTGNYPDPKNVPIEFLQEVIGTIRDKVNFYVIDVARTETGNWIVIELNDGQMSGLSAVDKYDEEIFYNSLEKALYE